MVQGSRGVNSQVNLREHVRENQEYRKEKKAMQVQYLTDDQGRRTAVVVPIEEWENLQAHIEYASDVTPEEILEANAEWEDYLKGPSKAKSVEQVIAEQLERRDD